MKYQARGEKRRKRTHETGPTSTESREPVEQTPMFVLNESPKEAEASKKNEQSNEINF